MKIISLNNSIHPFLTILTNAFKEYFAKLTRDIQSSFRFSNKKIFCYLSPLNIESFYITPTDSIGVPNIISSLNLDKSDRPSSIPTRNLKLLNKNISDQLAFLSN